MSIKKPTPVIDQPTPKICPVCRKRSYSMNGIHPQCAVWQAEEPRRIKLRAEKKIMEAEKHAESEKTRIASWKKKCPKCGLELHVRNQTCRCGHRFI